jgi:hypothetical protein
MILEQSLEWYERAAKETYGDIIPVRRTYIGKILEKFGMFNWVWLEAVHKGRVEGEKVRDGPTRQAGGLALVKGAPFLH